MTRKLYTVVGCGACDRVRNELKRLNLPYEEVGIGWRASEREEVFRLSGQRRLPVLVDGDSVISDSARIIAHLRHTYSAPRTV